MSYHYEQTWCCGHLQDGMEGSSDTNISAKGTPTDLQIIFSGYIVLVRTLSVHEYKVSYKVKIND